MKLKDNLPFGIVLAALLPVVLFFAIYLMRFSYYPFGEFLQTIRQESRLVTFFAAWALVGNIALFTLFINNRRDQSAKGIFIVTVVYGLLFLLLKWIW